MANGILLDSIISNVSREKVENVVNPPHTPTLKNKLNLEPGDIELIIPIKKEPTKFIIKVAIGKDILLKIDIWLHKYLIPAPIKPPKATNKKLIICYHLENKESLYSAEY